MNQSIDESINESINETIMHFMTRVPRIRIDHPHPHHSKEGADSSGNASVPYLIGQHV